MYNCKKNILAGFILLFVFVLIVGCSGAKEGSSKPGEGNSKETSNSGGKPQAGGELVAAAGADITSFDPILSTNAGDYQFLWPVYDTLTRYNSKLELQPGLAEKWEYPDDKTLVLHLRKGVKFHDGTDFDAEAVKINMERVKSKDSTISDFKNVESFEVVDPHTIKFHLKQPDASILLALAERAGIIVSPKAIKEYGKDIAQKPVGTGPFKFVKRVPNGEIVYEKFDGYWKEKEPFLDKLTIKIMPNETTRINALKSGEIDLIQGVSPFSVESLEGTPNIKVENVTSFTEKIIVFNAKKPPFDNKAFRQALKLAIDRKAITKTLLRGYGKPAYQIFPNEYWAANHDLKIDYDPEKAKQLLAESGVKKPSFSMITTTQDYYEPMFSDMLKEQFAKVGIEMKTESMEGTAAIGQFWSEKKFEAFSSGVAGKSDPHLLLEIWVAKDSFYNAGNHTTPELDKLIAEANATYDQTERGKLYSEINRIQSEEVINLLPVVSTPVIYAMNEKVKGFEPNGLVKSYFPSIWLEK